MGRVVDRRAAGIHPHVARIDRRERRLGRGQRVVEPQHRRHETSLVLRGRDSGGAACARCRAGRKLSFAVNALGTARRPARRTGRDPPRRIAAGFAPGRVADRRRSAEPDRATRIRQEFETGAIGPADETRSTPESLCLPAVGFWRSLTIRTQDFEPGPPLNKDVSMRRSAAGLGALAAAALLVTLAQGAFAAGDGETRPPRPRPMSRRPS